MSWSARRQLKIFSLLIIFIGLIIFLILFFSKDRTVSCFDAKQNGDEIGVDCGGACMLYCPAQNSPVVVRFSRAFPVTQTVWNAVASIENVNTDAVAPRVSYEFKLYDNERKFITSRVGETFIGVRGVSAIFEGGIQVGNRIPVYTTFTFTTEPTWYKPEEVVRNIKILGSSGVVSNTDTKPKLTGEIKNDSEVIPISNIRVVGLVYDIEGNLLGVSQTVVPSIAPGTSESVVFTWPLPFSGGVVKTEIIPIFNPFTIGR